MTISIDTFYTIFNTLLIIGYWIITVFVILRILMKRAPVTDVIAWLLIIHLLPVIGLFIYAFLGERRLGTKRATQAVQTWQSISKWTEKLKERDDIFATQISPVAEPLFDLCKHKYQIGGIKDNLLTLYKNAHDVIDKIVEDIDGAQKSVEMIFYIWSDKGKTIEVSQALIRAVKRGISCRIMLDSVGSNAFFRTEICRKMQKEGIVIIEALEVGLFRSLFRRIDLRQHRKLVIIDENISYTGSMNMVDPRFFKQNAGVGEWIDIMIRMVGPISFMMQMIYTFDWEMETDEHIIPSIPDKKFALDDKTGHVLQVIASGPGTDDNMISQSLLTAIYSARTSIIMTTPYFVPSDELLHAICTAAERGIDVHIILPTKNDSTMVQWASRTFFSTLLEAGVKLHKFNGGLLHTKSVLIDDELSLVGTVNLDMRSLWLNFEITAVIDDKGFGKDLKQLQHEYMSQSTLLRLEDWKKRPIWHLVIERLFYFFAPLL